ncbi:MAG: divalent-cation tolerance protein CutA [Hyphomonadaceae bacterium]
MLMLYSTWPNSESALACGRALIEGRLAGCASVLPGVTSVYRWEGAVQTEGEAVLLVKTSAAQAAQARDLILARHPYDLPCLIALPVEAAASHGAYLDWVRAETESGS